MSDAATTDAAAPDSAAAGAADAATDAAAEAVVQVSDADKAAAEEYKLKGNTLFKACKFDAAIEEYSFAISLDPTNAAYYSNRAFCYLKTEAFGLAVIDASTGIDANRRFVKNYYRRGAAHMAMGKFKEALKDFKQVARIAPADKDAQRKLKQCQKAVREQAFAACIENENGKMPSELTKFEDVVVEDTYAGPRIDETQGVTAEFVAELSTWFRDQHTLHRRYVYRIVLEIIALYTKTPTLVDVPIPKGTQFTVCGDVHGQYYDVLNIFAKNGVPSETNPYLFNGDFVDRGSFSVEVMLLFFAYKLLLPKHFHMARGNHESRTMNQIYGFQGEITKKCDANAYELFSEAFCLLPLAHVLQNQVFCVHGGLFAKDGVTLADVRKVDRVRQPPDSGLMCEMLWSDPQAARGRAPSKRGTGLSFGPDVTKRFCDDNGLSMVVRSHEVKEDGYHEMHDGRCVTIFSAPNYCDQMGNKGAYITFNGDDFGVDVNGDTDALNAGDDGDAADKQQQQQKQKQYRMLTPKYTTFTAVPHPPVRPMAYANSMYGGM